MIELTEHHRPIYPLATATRLCPVHPGEAALAGWSLPHAYNPGRGSSRGQSGKNDNIRLVGFDGHPQETGRMTRT